MRGRSTTRHLPCSMAPGQVAGFVVKGIRSGNGRASIPYVLSSAILLLLGAGTLNCGVPLWPESPYIRHLATSGSSRATVLALSLVRTLVQHFY